MKHILKRKLDSIISKFAVILLFYVYGTTYAISFLRRSKIRTGRKTKKLAVIGTFHNSNWFLSHVLPFVKIGAIKIYVVCDGPIQIEGDIQFICPPKLLSKAISRSLAKFLMLLMCGIFYKPDVYMGYHIFPGSISALIAARLFKKKAIYQDTSGPLELSGGGWQSENIILASLKKESKLVENLVIRIVKEFDAVIVRGSTAKQFVLEMGYRGILEIITGSVKFNKALLPMKNRKIDILFLGRLTNIKGPDVFVEMIHKIVRIRPDLKVAICGDGPELDNIIDKIYQYGLECNISLLGKRADVMDILCDSKIFLLTSRSESMSIALLEAMIAGVVPMVSNVGDLSDIIDEGVNGYLFNISKFDSAIEKICEILSDEKVWNEISYNAAMRSTAYSGIAVISEKWKELLHV